MSAFFLSGGWIQPACFRLADFFACSAKFLLFNDMLISLFLLFMQDVRYIFSEKILFLAITGVSGLPLRSVPHFVRYALRAPSMPAPDLSAAFSAFFLQFSKKYHRKFR